MLASFRPAALLLVVVFALTGCNVFQGLSDDSDDPVQLVQDARLARQAGDLGKARRLLENALVIDPASHSVRAELAGVRLQSEGINLIKLQRLVDHIARRVEGAGGASPNSMFGSFSGEFCTFQPGQVTELFDPRDMPGYDSLLTARPMLREVIALLRGIEPPTTTPTIPHALQHVNLCNVVVDGALYYPRDPILAQMRALPLTNPEINSVLADYATALMLESYFRVFEDMPAGIEPTWYQVQKQSGGYYVGFCVGDDNEQALKAHATDPVRDFGEAMLAIDLRSHNMGGETIGAELVTASIQSFDRLREELTDLCD
jgi:hypothetical protein